MTGSEHKYKLAVLVGPTAVGKTAISVNVAACLNAEIISGDSMQFYRYMNIGTAKISPDEMMAKDGTRIPHHLIDIINPDEPFSVADFQGKAAELIKDMSVRGKLPFVVGGTGLYISALTEGYNLNDSIGEDVAFRAAKNIEYAEKGGLNLLQELAGIDPITAAKLHANDGRRIIRALEVYHITGKPMSEQAGKAETPYQTKIICLNMDRQKLYERIDKRVDLMIENGLVSEVENLLNQGYSPNLKPLQGLGYRQIIEYLQGNATLTEAVERIKRDTRHFAKRQLTWWRHNSLVQWVNIDAFANEQDLLNEMCEAYNTL